MQLCKIPTTVLRVVMVALLSGSTASAQTQPAAFPKLGKEWPEIASEQRPWAYHWWLGSAVDKENLARELRRYRDGGLGGVHIVPIYGAKGAESRSIEYLSPRWMEMLSFTVNEANSLGLGVDMTTGTGWCFGGPSISRELACRDAVIRKIAFPPDGKLPADLCPPQLTVQAVIASGPDGTIRKLTAGLGDGDSLGWSPPGDGWSLYVLGHRYVERMVKRAAPGGRGPMLNRFYTQAMQTYLERFTEAFRIPGIRLPRAMYHDSFEYRGDWSPDLPAEFARRRGYRLENELPALAGEGDADRVARVRCDVSETRSDMMVEAVFSQWARWCQNRGIATRMQAHGADGNWLDLYALSTIPETEMFGKGGPDPLVSRFDEYIGEGDRDPLMCKFASSAAHAAGRRLTAAETGTWLAEHFCETLEALKCEADLMFLSGVNHIFYHGCVYSPDDVAWPGWLFYASTQMNPRNPLWREAPALNDYVARCQSVLQSGLPDNDVLLYWPIHDLWNAGVRDMSVHNKAALGGAFGDTARALWSRGYSFDYVSDRLLQSVQADGNVMRAPGGASWQVVVVPLCRQMPDATLAKLMCLAEQGATVIFQRALPQDVPGLGRLDERRAAFEQQMARLGAKSTAADSAPGSPGPRTGRLAMDGDGPVRELRCGKGRVLVGNLEEALTEVGVRRETLVDHPGLKFIRRAHEKGRHYFIVNHGMEPMDGWLPLATPAESAVVMDPLTAKRGAAQVRHTATGAAEVYVCLEPGHSTILRTLEQAAAEAPAWVWSRPGQTLTELAGPWQVEFIAGGPTLPGALKLDALTSWTRAGGAAESFAGTARYRCRFDLAAAPVSSPLLLDLGEVKHLARVRINGQDQGALIMHPYRLALPPGLLRPKDNLLEIEVTNLAANRIRDLDRRGVEWKHFYDANVLSITYKAFDASKWPLFESGLLGPVRVRRSEPSPSPSLSDHSEIR